MIELLLVVVIAGIGMLVIGRAFASTSTGTERTQAKAVQAAKKEKAQPVAAKPKVTKKQAAAKAAEEAEMDRLINQSAQSVSGMTTDKKKVISLDVSKNDTNVSNKKEKVEISTKQRMVEAEEGFAIVEKKDKAPSQKFRKEKAKKKDDQAKDKNLNNFFKAQDAKGRASKGVKPSKDSEEKESKPAGSVTMRKKITSDAKDTWANTYSE